MKGVEVKGGGELKKDNVRFISLSVSDKRRVKGGEFIVYPEGQGDLGT